MCMAAPSFIVFAWTARVIPAPFAATLKARTASTSARVIERFDRSRSTVSVPSRSPRRPSNTRSSIAWSFSSTTTAVTRSGPSTAAQRSMSWS